jgi:Pectate lyase superfamily protein
MCGGLEVIMSNVLKTLLLVFAMPLIVLAQQKTGRPLASKGSGSPDFKIIPIPLPIRPILPILPTTSYASEVDVTAYGAIGDGRTDDTVAIQNALAAACSPPGQAGTGVRADLVFPPGQYLVTQTQAPSNAPIFSSCGALRFLGLGGDIGGAQFLTSPQARIIVQPGPSPNSAPAIRVPFPGTGVTIEDLIISGYNQAVFVSGALTHLINDCLTAVTTGMPDNTPLEIDDTIWVWVEGGCLATNSPSVPSLEIVNDNVAAATGLIDIENVIATVGAFQLNVRAPTSSAVLGNLDFRNITIEDAAADFLTVINTSGSYLYLNSLRFQNVELSDSAPGSFSILKFDPGVGGRILGLHMVDAVGSGGAPVINMLGSAAYFDTSITTCFTCADNPDGTVVNSHGSDYTSNLVIGNEGTGGNCQSNASPAACGSAQAGMVAVPAGEKYLVVNDTSAGLNSEIQLTFDSSLGEALGVTCNTEISQPSVSARVANSTIGVNFTISMSEAAAPNPDCIAFRIVN